MPVGMYKRIYLDELSDNFKSDKYGNLSLD